jgi:hypothetical protein
MRRWSGRLLLALALFALALAGCSGGAATPAASVSFRSPLYGYTVRSASWTGTPTTTPWDGSGAPGDAEPVVDTLTGPAPHTFAFGTQTSATLDGFADQFDATDSTVHDCPAKPESSTKITVGGAPARLDAKHCSAGAVYVLTAFVVRGGRATVFATYDQPVKTADQPSDPEGSIRAKFSTLLEAISFD